jgi:thioredoxin reductase (NADPH)
VLRPKWGAAALEILRELKVRTNGVALFLIDERMPGLSGVEFLAQAISLYPDAKRVLLTA